MAEFKYKLASRSLDTGGGAALATPVTINPAVAGRLYSSDVDANSSRTDVFDSFVPNVTATNPFSSALSGVAGIANVIAKNAARVSEKDNLYAARVAKERLSSFVSDSYYGNGETDGLSSKSGLNGVEASKESISAIKDEFTRIVGALTPAQATIAMVGLDAIKRKGIARAAVYQNKQREVRDAEISYLENTAIRKAVEREPSGVMFSNQFRSHINAIEDPKRRDAAYGDLVGIAVDSTLRNALNGGSSLGDAYKAAGDMYESFKDGLSYSDSSNIRKKLSVIKGSIEGKEYTDKLSKDTRLRKAMEYGIAVDLSEMARIGDSAGYAASIYEYRDMYDTPKARDAAVVSAVTESTLDRAVTSGLIGVSAKMLAAKEMMSNVIQVVKLNATERASVNAFYSTTLREKLAVLQDNNDKQVNREFQVMLTSAQTSSTAIEPMLAPLGMEPYGKKLFYAQQDDAISVQREMFSVEALMERDSFHNIIMTKFRDKTLSKDDKPWLFGLLEKHKISGDSYGFALDVIEGNISSGRGKREPYMDSGYDKGIKIIEMYKKSQFWSQGNASLKGKTKGSRDYVDAVVSNEEANYAGYAGLVKKFDRHYKESYAAGQDIDVADWIKKETTTRRKSFSWADFADSVLRNTIGNTEPPRFE